MPHLATKHLCVSEALWAKKASRKAIQWTANTIKIKDSQYTTDGQMAALSQLMET